MRKVPEKSRGSALGIYTAFIDLSMGISGPIAGVIVSAFGYPPIFLFALVAAVVSGLFLAGLWRHENRELNKNQSLALTPNLMNQPFAAKDLLI